MTDEGSLDAALLLLLDSAHLFDDQSVPDEIRIAFTKALEKKARIETRNLFPNMQVFETDEALVLVDPATNDNDIWKLTDSIDPIRLMAVGSDRGKRSAISHRAAPRDCPRPGSRNSSGAPLILPAAPPAPERRDNTYR
ncbi:MAG: hypothetical protein WA231_07705 [Methylocella sp.]